VARHRVPCTSKKCSGSATVGAEIFDCAKRLSDVLDRPQDESAGPNALPTPTYTANCSDAFDSEQSAIHAVAQCNAPRVAREAVRDEAFETRAMPRMSTRCRIRERHKDR
jgi:hypothetical protein